MYLSKFLLNKISSTSDYNVSSVSFLDIPFFFNDRSRTFYRFEASILNFHVEPLLKNFALTWGLNFKFTFKILMSMFFVQPSQRLIGTVNSPKFYTYLFANSFFNRGSANFKNMGNSFLTSKNSFYSGSSFYKPGYDILLQQLYNFPVYLTDQAIDIRLSINRFNTVTYSGYQTIDNFVSTYNSSLSSFDLNNSIGVISKIKFPVQNYVLIGSSSKTTSFFVSSFDNSLLYDTY